jgi:hypothetical protein
MESLNSAASKSEARSVRVIVTAPGAVESPSAWMQYGTSPTEIILAIAIVIGAIAGVIGSIALLVQVLVPVMRSNPPKQ